MFPVGRFESYGDLYMPAHAETGKYIHKLTTHKLQQIIQKRQAFSTLFSMLLLVLNIVSDI